MSEIKVGEYVRTKNEGIKKIDHLNLNATINRYTYFLKIDKDGDRCYGILKTTDILKHSFNIIDLIEVDDYVNGYRVISVDKDVLDIHTDCIELDLNNNYQYNFLTINQIKSILTKEQFAESEYKVNE